MRMRRLTHIAGYLLMIGVVLATAACGTAGVPPTPGAGPPPAAPAAPPPSGAATPAPTAPESGAVRPFMPTSEEHLSTFGLDVDTGSYTAARNYLRAGQLPPPATVRVEEFVNYFHYDYPAPAQDAFGIYVDAAPSPFSPPGTQIVRIGIQGRPVDPAQRPPATLTFVIDTSGSMDAANKLPLVQQALDTLVDALGPQDQVALVTFSDQAQVVLDYTSASQRDTLHQAIHALQASGSTYAEAGLQLGYQWATQHFRAGGINRVILCSDGVANVGAIGPEAILQTIHAAAGQGIDLTTVGFGMGDYNDRLMEQLADHGNGQYAYVDTPNAARRIFVTQLTSTLQVLARDAKVQVDFNPTVVSRFRLLGYENRALPDPAFRNDAAPAGEVGAGHSVTALYEVNLTEQRGAALTVLLRYADPHTGEVHELRHILNTSDAGHDLTTAAPRLQLAVAVAGFAAQLQHPTPASDAALADLRTNVQPLAVQLKDPDVEELVQLLQQAREIGQRTGWASAGSPPLVGAVVAASQAAGAPASQAPISALAGPAPAVGTPPAWDPNPVIRWSTVTFGAILILLQAWGGLIVFAWWATAPRQSARVEPPAPPTIGARIAVARLAAAPRTAFLATRPAAPRPDSDPALPIVGRATTPLPPLPIAPRPRRPAR